MNKFTADYGDDLDNDASADDAAAALFDNIPKVEKPVVAVKAEAPAKEKEEKTDEEAKVFNYRGEIVEVNSLRTAGAVALEIPEIDVAAIANGGWGGQAKQKLPKLVISVDVSDSSLGKKYCQLTYLSYLGKRKFQKRAISLPLDFKVKKLTGKQAAKMTDAYRAAEFENLAANLEHGFMVGSDPEVFVEDAEGKVIPAFDFLGAKKDTKNRTRQNRAVYWDGPQAEFETVAGKCLAYHVDSIQEGLQTVHEAARKHNKDARLSMKTVMEVGYDVLQNAKEEHIAFGCAPSNNLYGLKGKDVPARELPLRSAGGHIHFGIGEKNKNEALVKDMVRALDNILGVLCVSLFQKLDNPIRRQFYGMAGEYRTPAHGLEYRTLSNAVVCHPMITHLCFELARKSVVFGEKGFNKFWNATEEETVNCIQNCDVELAHKIMERNKATILKVFKAAYHYLTDKQLENAYHIFYDGVEAAIKNPADLAANWKLDGGWVIHSGADGASCNAGMQKVQAGGLN